MITYVNFLISILNHIFLFHVLFLSQKLINQIVLNYIITGTYQPPSTIVLFHEPPRHSNLAIRARRVRPCLGDDVRGREDQPLRME